MTRDTRNSHGQTSNKNCMQFVANNSSHFSLIDDIVTSLQQCLVCPQRSCFESLQVPKIQGPPVTSRDLPQHVAISSRSPLSRFSANWVLVTVPTMARIEANSSGFAIRRPKPGTTDIPAELAIACIAWESIQMQEETAWIQITRDMLTRCSKHRLWNNRWNLLKTI